MNFIGNLFLFSAVNIFFENRLRFDDVTRHEFGGTLFGRWCSFKYMHFISNACTIAEMTVEGQSMLLIQALFNIKGRA